MQKASENNKPNILIVSRSLPIANAIYELASLYDRYKCSLAVEKEFGRENFEEDIRNSDAVILDLTGDPVNPVIEIEHILQSNPLTKIIVLHYYPYIETSDQMIARGASAYLNVTTTVQQLHLAIKTVLNGETYRPDDLL